MLPLLQDIRFALRMLRKSPGAAFIIVLSLAIGIGANTAIFSVVNGLLLRPLPYPHADRLSILWLRSPGIGIPQDWPSPGQYIDLKTQNHVFEKMAICIGDPMTLTGRDQPERVGVFQTSSTLFDLLGARPLLGRTLLPEEDAPGKPPVAILAHGAWKRLFGGDPNVLGRTLLLNGKPYTVAGVLAPGFLLNYDVIPTVGGVDKADVLIPLPLGADAAHQFGDENYNIVARLKPGVTMREAQADVDVIARRIRQEHHRDRSFTISVVPLLEQVVGNVRRAVLVLLGSIMLVLLIACANVANLLLSRAAAREKETVIRAALGAGRSRLVRQLLTESLVLAVCGGVVGLLLAFGSLAVVRVMNPGNIPRLENISIDGVVLAFTFGISVVTGIVFGLAPALRVSRVDLNTTLKFGGRSSGADSGLDIRRHGLRAILVTGEVALSLMLLIAAGLLIRSFERLGAVPPGFSADHVISMHVAPSGPKYREDKALIEFYRELGERVRRLPGVLSEGVVTALPLTPSVGWGFLTIRGYTPPPNQELQTDMRGASPDYFRTMKIPLIQGRFFSDHDTAESQKVVLIDQKMARHFWPAGDAIGKQIKPGSDAKKPWWTIAGVVGVVKEYGLDTDTRMVVYFPETQTGWGDYLVARTTGDPALLAGPITREVHAIDPDIAVFDVSTMQERLHASLARQRFSMTMLGAFAVFALILAAVGVYGVLSFLVTQATHDIGVRVALGAQESSILRLVMTQGGTLAAIGIGAGLIGAFALTRVMASLLFGVSAHDAVTYCAVALFLGVVALVASYVPARRAMKVDPMIALRYE